MAEQGVCPSEEEMEEEEAIADVYELQKRVGILEFRCGQLLGEKADLLAALKVATDKIEAWRDGALITRNWAVGTSIPDMEKLIASYNAIIDPARAAIEKAS